MMCSFLLNNNPRNSSEVNVTKNGIEFTHTYDNDLQVIYHVSDSSGYGWKGDFVFHNRGRDTLIISNVIPFGEDVVLFISQERGHQTLQGPGFSVRVISR